MEFLQNRVTSFSKQKRVKNLSKPSSSVSLRWPHPSHFTANPESLAEAGFYFDPSFEDRDNVTCYMCKKQLSDWEEKDDPFDIHWSKCGIQCCWASVRCGLRGDMDRHGGYIFPDKTRLPGSKNMERARLETFSAGDGWIHDQEKNHGANSRNMARAGFVYLAQHPGDDLATCLYCSISLSGWDAEDDPMEEHSKRDKKNGSRCPFFNSPESSLTTTTKPSSHTQSQSKSKSKPSSKSQQVPQQSRSTSASRYKEPVLHNQTRDGSDDGSEPSTSRRPARGRTPSGLRKLVPSQSRSRLGNVAEDDGGVEGEEQETVRGGKTRRTTAAKSKGTSRSKSVSRQVADLLEESDDVVIEKTASRSRSKMKEKVSIEESNDVDAEEVEVARKSVRGKGTTVSASRKSSRTKKAQTRVESDPESDVEEAKEDLPRPTSRAKTKTSATTSRKPSHKKSKAVAIVANESVIDDSEARENEVVVLSRKKPDVKSKPPAGTILSTSRKKSKTQEETDPEDVWETPKESPSQQDKTDTSPHTTFGLRQASPSADLPNKQLTGKVEIPINDTFGQLSRLIVPKRNLRAKEQYEGVARAVNVDKDDKRDRREAERRKGFSPVPVEPSVAKEHKWAIQPVAKPTDDKGNHKSKKVNILKVVEISTDEEDGEGVEDGDNLQKKEGRVEEIIAIGTSSQPELKKESEQASTLIVESAKLTNPEDVSKSRPPLPTLEPHAKDCEDVEMSGPNEDEGQVLDVPMLNGAPPVTPPRFPSAIAITDNTDPTLVCPPLSKLPFMPLHSLTDAELDMTVEEWIRYQIEVEYDKFRRDGERELLRFKRRAEEVRGVIEKL